MLAKKKVHVVILHVLKLQNARPKMHVLVDKRMPGLGRGYPYFGG